jgi:phospholipid/cholesterol/gamma-HCH transport system substrate-binding protein
MIMARSRHLAYGIGFLVMLALVVALTVALYDRSFDSTKKLTVHASRAGLTMDTGAAVKLRGVQIGRVTGVTSSPDGASLELEIDSEYFRRIPSDVTAQLVPPTAFGAKYVQLTAPADGAAAPIAAGAEIGADHVTVEANDAFAHLMDLLHAANPLEVNNAVSAIANGVDGRGTQLGELLADIDTYLDGLNPHLPKLSADLPKLADVLGTYRDITPDLLRLARNTTTTSDTLVQRQASLDAMLISLTNFSGKARGFLNRNGKPLASLLDYLDPTTQVLARYAPVLPCMLEGLVIDNAYAERAVGGVVPGISTYTILRPADTPYTTAKNLPVAGADNGPDCHGLPRINAAEAASAYPDYNTGSHAPDDNPPAATRLKTTLFGLLAGLVNSG